MKRLQKLGILGALVASGGSFVEPASAFTIEKDGDLSIQINMKFPPTTGEVEYLEDTVHKAQLLLCDATDRRVKLNEVVVTVGAQHEVASDLWYYSDGISGRAHAGDRIIMFGKWWMNGDVLAHELGHYILGLPDAYDEQRRMGGPCGIGHNFERGTRDDWDNTLMQQGDNFLCRNSSGQRPEDIDPRVGGRRCVDDTDCVGLSLPGHGNFDTCAYPVLMSELTVTTNHDAVRGRGGVCSPPLPGRILNVQADVGEWSSGLMTSLCDEDNDSPRHRAWNATCADGTDPGRVDGLDLTSLDDAVATAGLHHEGVFEVFDEYGLITGAHEGDSNHRIRLFGRVYEKTLTTMTMTLGVVGDADDYVGGEEGEIVELARFQLTFDEPSQQLIEVNGIPVDAAGAGQHDGLFPMVTIGGGPAIPFGTPTQDATGKLIWGQTTATGAFNANSNGDVASPVNLQMRFGGMQFGNLLRATGGTYGRRFWRGVGRSEVLNADGVPQQALCENASMCQHSWNNLTHRFEATDATRGDLNSGNPVRSEWKRVADSAAGIGIHTFAAPDLVDPVTPTVAQCGGPVTFKYLDPMESSQVVLVLDRSGSMSKKPGESNHDTRMEFAQAAARQIIRVFEDENHSAAGMTDAAYLGLVSFNEAPKKETLMLPIGNRPGFWNKPAALIDRVNGLEPSGRTAMGLGLRSAADMMIEDGRPGRTIVLLSDGANNEPKDGSAEPEDVAKELMEEGFQIIYIPTSQDADRDLSHAINAGGGSTLDAPSAYDVIPKFFEMYAHTRGETLAILPLAVEVEGKQQVPAMLETPWYQDAFGWATGIVDPVAYAQSALPESIEIPIFVEHGSDTLNVMLSVRAMDSGSWKPDFTLRDPSGEAYAFEGCTTCDRATVLSDRFFRVIRVQSPPDGPWTLEVSANEGAGVQRSFVAAHIANDGPECLASAKLSADGEYIEVKATAAYNGLLHSGVTYDGVLAGPDGSSLPLEFEQPIGKDTGVLARVELADLTYRGVYTAEVDCTASEDAKEHPGEGALLGLGLELGTNDADELNEPEETPVGKFRRYAKSYIFVSEGESLAPCDGGIYTHGQFDCNDTDGDGIPNALDGDDDNDDVPDEDDDNPLVPDLHYWLPEGCEHDEVAPAIEFDAAEFSACQVSPELSLQVTANVSDDSCEDNGHIELAASVVEVNGATTVIPVPITSAGVIEMSWAPGEYVVEVLATDINGNETVATKRVSFETDPNSAELCCLSHQTLVAGTASHDHHLVWPWRDECVFGRGAPDSLTSLGSNDYVAGGKGGDLLIAFGGQNVLAGGGGNDVVTTNGDDSAIHGGNGRDVINMHRDGDVWGGRGADMILGGHGNQHIRPGAGADFVTAGGGDDRIVICAAEAGEVIDGGSGNDTLVSPLSIHDLLVRGVIVVDVENVTVRNDDLFALECDR